VPTHRSAEPVRSGLALVSTTAPNYLQRLPMFTNLTDHYLNYNAVLVRMSRVTPDVLRDLLGMAHKFVTADVARRSPSRKRGKPV
jgi:hypothetical protein